MIPESWKRAAMGMTQRMLFKASDNLATAGLSMSRPESYGAYLDVSDGKLQRNQGGGRLVVSPRTLWQMAHTDPFTWAIHNKFKSKITKMDWTVGPNTENQEAELLAWEEIIMAWLSPLCPESFNPNFEPRTLPMEVAAWMGEELMKLKKDPKGRAKARWIFDTTLAILRVDRTGEAAKAESFLDNCNEDTPDPFHTLLEFICDNLLIYDAAAIIKRRRVDGQPLEMYSIDGSQVVRYRNPDLSTPRPPYRAYGWEPYGKNIADFTTEGLLYMMMNPQQSGYGWSPVEATVHTVMATLYGDAYNLDMFRGQIPPGIVNLGEVSDAQRIRFRTEWENEVLGRGGVHRLMFLNVKGTKDGKSPIDIMNTMQFKNKDMQFMDYIKWNSRIKLMCHNVSPQTMGWTEFVHKETSQNQQEETQDGIDEMAGQIEDFVTRDIVMDFCGCPGAMFRFKRGDAAADAVKADMWDKFIKNGTLTVNDVRRKIGVRPYADYGDEPYVMTGKGPVLLSEIFARAQSAREIQDGERQALPPGKKPGAGQDPAEPVEGEEAGEVPPEVEAAQEVEKGMKPDKKKRLKAEVMEAAKRRKGLVDAFAQSIKESVTAQTEKAQQKIDTILKPE